MRRPILWAAILILGFVLAATFCSDECRRHGGKGTREATLQDNLFSIRQAIDNFYGDKRTYPRELQDLVPNYLRKIPIDPVTEKASWTVIRERTGGVVDVRTDAKGKTCRGQDYSEL